MINVVGAGPAGSFFSLNAKDEVRIFEEHKEVGKPVACTGILTSAITDLINLDKNVIANKIKRVRLIAPNGDYYVFKLKNEETIVYRDKFDKFLIEKALDKGVELYKHHRFLNSKKNGKIISEFETDKGKKTFSSDILVGADGPTSKVAQASGLYANRKNWVGKQYTANLSMEKDVFYVYFGDVPDFFGWVVPESDTKARVGVASEKNVSTYFDILMKKLKLNKKDLYECQAGPIPMYDPKNITSKDNVYLIGDAAGLVKATTGGGIVYGMRAGKILAECLNNNLNYEKEWRKELNKDLMFHLRIRKFLNKLDEKDYNELIKALKTIDLGNFNRDYPLRNLGMFMKPRLFGFFLKNFYKVF